MRTLFAAAAAAGMLLLASPVVSLAQGARGGGYGRSYNPQTVWTVSGEVLAIDKVADGRRGGYGVHVLLKTVKGDLPVHLGPSWFLERQAMKIAVHDVIEVTGSPVIYAGKPALLAAEVRKGSESMRLRTADGLPLWRRAATR